MSKKKLMLVESPSKSKKIQGFLGSNYKVLATVGSMFDIENPTSDAGKTKYPTHGINTQTWERNLKCSNSKQFGLIKAEVASGQYDTLIVSTDPDRAGSQIGQEVVDALSAVLKKHNVKVIRATWNEITQAAVQAGLKNAGVIDQAEVAAATARQIYDRLFGFSISPVLWKTIARGTSGGRVQSPALRLVVNREKERLAFVKASYMSITGLFAVGVKGDELAAKLVSVGERKIAQGSSFGSDGKVKNNELVITPENVAKLEAFLKKGVYEVADVSTKPYSRKPPAPYTTSSFQQDVGTRTRLGSKQIMSVAQKLYENSYITYMRTDSPNLSQEGTDAARAAAVALFGKASVPAQARAYKAKSKNAQEGHEAIRPTVDKAGKFVPPAQLAAALNKIDKNALKVYECIYNRTVASQMNDAKGFTTTVKIATTNTPADKTAVFSTSATTFTDPGWTALTKPVSEDEEENNSLSAKVDVGDEAKLKKLARLEHTTTPPARFTEPQLVAKLEELGIGRPSTYASIVTVNQTRGYVGKKGQQLYPSWTGMKVAQYLEAKIPSFVAYEATAQMEDELDKIEQGQLKQAAFLKTEWAKILKDVVTLEQNINWDEVTKLGTIPVAGPFVVRVNSYGHWLEDSSVPVDSEGKRKGVKLADNESVADIDFTDEAEVRKLYEAGSKTVDARELGVLQAGTYAGWTVTARDGKYGPFVQALPPETVEAYAKGEKAPAKAPKAINHKLPEGKELADVTLADVEPLYAEVKLPRNLSEQLFVGIGKRGPWLGYKASAKSRKATFVSLPEDKDPRTITLAEAKAVWEENKK